ncbi:MAG: hypothetical protein C0392_06845 [Syntrophus sp. (in: bacteria)]|nr:hypothetical protein [Syntrophus sp. (in: bacteria)]
MKQHDIWLRKALNMIVRDEQGNAKTILLKELKSSLRKGDVDIQEIYTLQKTWKFKGSISDEVIAEREKK